MDIACYMGKGIRELTAPYRTVMVFGAELNSITPGSLSSPLAIVEPVKVLDLSALAPNHEAIVALVVTQSVSSTVVVTFKWFRTGVAKPLYEISIPLVPPTPGQIYNGWSVLSYIGFVPWEISENGDYRVEISADGKNQTLPFTVTGIGAAPAPVDTSNWGLLEIVHPWFTNFYNQVLAWISAVAEQAYALIKPAIDAVYEWISTWANWIYESISPLFAQVWDWIQSAADSIIAAIRGLPTYIYYCIQDAITAITAAISPLFAQVWSWIETATDNLYQLVLAQFTALSQSLNAFASDIEARVSAINTWFSDEFIDPFLDWLLKLPSNIVTALRDYWSWYWHELVLQVRDPTSPLWICWYSLIGIAIIAIIAAAAPIAAAVVSAVRWAGGIIASLSPAIGGWFAALLPKIMGWFRWQVAIWGLQLPSLLATVGGWWLKHCIPLMGAGSILTLEATGQLNTIISNYVTPAITGVFDWAESIGPVSPQPGRDMSVGITKLAEFTISGLAAMTLAGEFLSPLKHIGLGHISAVLYDLINYKTLTAAFMGVLAFVYIKQPLTYYYQKIARPNLPDERSLAAMVEDRAITPGEYIDNMRWHGLPDSWIGKLYDTLYRPMTPYMLRSLAEAGLLDDALLDHALKHAGYDDISIAAIKTMMQRLSTGTLQTVAVSSAMSRYKDGLDSENVLKLNLSALGVSDALLSRYLYAANLQYLTDYQNDLIAYHIDAYHRRDIEEPALRQNLVADGLSPERIEPVVSAQKIKRLAAPKPAALPELAIQVDTIRDRRKKNLLSHAEELEQLVAIGQELPLASAIADNDDVAIAEAKPLIAQVPTPYYESDEGKIKADTIRRLRRARQLTNAEELKALTALEMPQSMAAAIVDNDTLRLKKETPTES